MPLTALANVPLIELALGGQYEGLKASEQPASVVTARGIQLPPHTAPIPSPGRSA